MKPRQIMARLKAPLAKVSAAGRDATSRDEAEAREEAEAPHPRPRSPGRARRASIAAQPVFVPLVSGWGAALLGLAVLVLPPAATARAALLTGLDALGAMAHFVFAAVAAMGGGALAFGIARALSRKAKGRSGGLAIIRGARLKGSRGTAAQDTDPINPREELGSESLDAPIVTMPLGIEPEHWLEKAGPVADPADAREARPEPAPEDTPERQPGSAAAPQDESAINATESVAAAVRRRLARVSGAGRTPEPAGEGSVEARQPEPESGPTESAPTDSAPTESAPPESARAQGAAPGAGDPETGPSVPRSPPAAPPALDLAQFGALPGRNAVWVEGPLPEEFPRPEGGQAVTPRDPSPESPVESATGSAKASAALARLRSTPAEDLSLVEMVERLAAALHERQAADATRPRAAGARADGRRDAALAEALKALGDLTGDRARTPAGSGEADDLAAALARLHDMRGAA